MEQLKTNIESVNVTLSSEILNEINNIQKKFQPMPIIKKTLLLSLFFIFFQLQKP